MEKYSLEQQNGLSNSGRSLVEIIYLKINGKRLKVSESISPINYSTGLILGEKHKTTITYEDLSSELQDEVDRLVQKEEIEKAKVIEEQKKWQKQQEIKTKKMQKIVAGKSRSEWESLYENAWFDLNEKYGHPYGLSVHNKEFDWIQFQLLASLIMGVNLETSHNRDDYHYVYIDCTPIGEVVENKENECFIFCDGLKIVSPNFNDHIPDWSVLEVKEIEMTPKV